MAESVPRAIALWIAFALALVLAATLAFRAGGLTWAISIHGLRFAAQGVFVLMALLAWQLGSRRTSLTTTRPDPSGRTHALLALIALVTAFGLYARTLGDYLFADDYQFWALTLRGHYSSLIALFTPGATYYPHGYFRPVGLLFYALDHAVWGEWRTGLHVTTLLIHAVATYLTALLAWRLSGQPAVAIITALLYGTHPVRFEVATFVSAREVAVSAIGYLGALLLVLRYVAGGSVGWLLASVAAFVAGLLAKELALSLPLAVMLIAWGARSSARHRALIAAAVHGAVVAAWAAFQWESRGMLATSGHHVVIRRTVE
ncbi:MAG: hypothetical protein HY216_00865, partial [Candidatus Rokubacteria bacterium]|nr:hypothetical protein [Candidatus Rokubacteria bacterium]